MSSTGICVQVFSGKSLIEQKLRVNGFKLKQSYTEYDTYFTHLTKDLIKNVSYSTLMQNSILLRTKKSINSEENLMIFKNKTLNTLGEVIKEETLESTLGNIEESKRIFIQAGLIAWSRLVVEQTEFVKGSLTISLQNVPGLGTFIEIVEYSKSKLSSENLFKEMVYIANSFGLDIGKDYSCKKNYMLFKKFN